MRTWFITGCGTGFGRALAIAALTRGDRVAVTDRDAAAVADIAARFPDTAITLGVDVTRPEQVRDGLARAVAAFSRIDVLVNNAGRGLLAAVEEASDEQVRQMFDVNFFGMLDVIRAALPYLREQGGGHIVNFSSVGGRVAHPLVALYSASKFAVEAIGEGLAREVGPMGIAVTTVEPGSFATNFGAAGMTADHPLPHYEPIRSEMSAQIGRQPSGDPADLAAAIIEVVDSASPPLRFIGGVDAYELIEESLAMQQEEMRRWRRLSVSAGTAAASAS